jgi:hypothetical protein
MKHIALLLLVSLIVMPTAALCRENPANAVDFQAQLQQTAERLELSDTQLAELTPILRTQFDETRALLERYGLDRYSAARLDRRKLLAFSSELNALREATEPQIAAILSKEQMAAYRKIQDEQRARMRAQFRARTR